MYYKHYHTAEFFFLKQGGDFDLNPIYILYDFWYKLASITEQVKYFQPFFPLPFVAIFYLQVHEYRSIHHTKNITFTLK